MRERPRERQQLVGLGARRDVDRLDLSGQEPALEREIVGDDAPGEAGLDIDRLGLDGSTGRGQGEVLRRVVPRVDAQERHQVAEPLDERRLGVHAPASGARVGETSASCIAPSRLSQLL